MEHENNIQDLLSKFNDIEALILKNNNIHKIEKDIVLGKLRKLYETVTEIHPVKAAVEVKESESSVISEEISEKNDEVEAVTDEVVIDAKEESGSEAVSPDELIVIREEEEVEEKEVNRKISQATLFDTGHGDSANNIVSKTSAQSGKDVKKESGNARTLSEKYGKNLKQTVSEKMSPKGNEEDLSSRISLTPISKIEHGINVNERIMFIREIFNNNSQEYNDCISEIEKVNGYEEAIEYLKSITGGIDNVATKKLKAVILRRFVRQK